MVFDILDTEKPAGGWAAGAKGSQSSITPINRQDLVRVYGRWLIEKLVIRQNMPSAF